MRSFLIWLGVVHTYTHTPGGLPRACAPKLDEKSDVVNAASTEPLNGYAARLAAASAVSAVAVTLLGAVVLVGWWLDIAVLKSLTIRANTAVGFMLAGTALWLQRNEPVGYCVRFAGSFCAALVALLGLATLAEILSGQDFGIDNALFSEVAAASKASAPGQMSPTMAFNFLFSGIALLLLDLETRRGLRPAQWLILLPLAVTFITLTGYVYGAEHYHSLAYLAGFSLLGFGLLWARPARGLMALVSSGTSGGLLVRRIFPLVLVAVSLLFWLRVLGERAGYFGADFGVSLMVLATIVLLGSAFWWSAYAINRRERECLRAESELRKFALGVEQTPLSIIITNTDAEIEYVNSAFVQLTGYGRAEAIGQNPRFMASGKTTQASFDDLWNTLAQGKPWLGEFINKTKDGREYVDHASILPLHQPDGRISHYVGVQMDVTEQKRLTEELERHRAHLEELVAERTTQLEEAKVKAEAATLAKSSFLANMSHEIRTPLNAVLGLARIGVRENQGRKTGETCRKIQDAGQHLLGVINDILDFSKIESGKLKVERLPFQPAAVIANVCSFVTGAASDKGLDFRVETRGMLPDWLLGDSLRLQQILANLLSNAVKFAARGTVRLVISRAGDETCFSVIDEGIGMSAEQVGRLFQPFEQADSSTTRQFGGAGLGLAISRQLAELMGGVIEVESSPDHGSTFSLNLPLPATEPPEQEATNAEKLAPAERRLDGVRILAAEDVEVNRVILADILDQAGAIHVLVENGAQAVEQIAHDASAFHVVLMDVQMPVMDGYVATQRIRELAPGLPVIGLTAHSLAEEIGKCLAAGMVDHVTKPVDPDALVAAILGHAACAALPRQASAAPVAVPPALTFASQLIDWHVLRARFNRKDDFLRKLAKTALISLDNTEQELADAIAQRDCETLAYTAHSIRGMARNLFARQVADLAKSIERAARVKQPGVFDLAGQLIQLLGRFRTELASLARSADGAD